ncbi:MAG: histidinol dehydrogenase [Clostridiales bacterium]|nr:histidinol dehydrogenase [Clostridiales bacterium]
MKCKKINAPKGELKKICEELGMRGKMELGPIIDTVNAVLDDIRKNGDKAVFAYTKKFDKADIDSSNVRVTDQEIADAIASLDPNLVEVIRKAAANILAFHEKQVETGFKMDVAKGSEIGMRVRPISVAGIYVPGGTAPLPSTVLMNVIPARAAGCPRIVLCTPPRADGSIAPVILAAASIAGATEIYKVGGSQAIGAMAYGTESIPRVDKICGPGNIYVNTAKRLVFGQVDIDMFAGPSEILIIADDTAVPEFVAADFLSQAEHDVLASAILLTTSEKLADAVYEAVDRRSEKSLRKEILAKSLPTYCAILVVDDMEAALAFSEELAPEHLELCVADPDNYIDRINNAGAIFVGNYTPEPLGDYFAGPNHTLPTSGTARFFSPLNTGDFFKKISVLRYNEESLRDCYKDVAAFADAEGLECHASAVRVRFEE